MAIYPYGSTQTFGNSMGGGMTIVDLSQLSGQQLGQQGISSTSNPGSNPYAPTSSASSSTSLQNGATSSGGFNFGGAPLIPGREATPSYTPYNYSSAATDYPTYLKNLGENMSQSSFQNQVNQGIRLGNSAQGYMHAQDGLNQNRLGYMATAGQQQMAVEKQLADENERRNQLLYGNFNSNITQRGQDIGGMASFYNSQARAASGGGSGWSSSGSSSSSPTSGGPTGTYQSIGGTMTGSVPGYTDIYGNRNSSPNFSSQYMPIGVAAGSGTGWTGGSGSSTNNLPAYMGGTGSNPDFSWLNLYGGTD